MGIDVLCSIIRPASIIYISCAYKIYKAYQVLLKGLKTYKAL